MSTEIGCTHGYDEIIIERLQKSTKVFQNENFYYFANSQGEINLITSII